MQDRSSQRKQASSIIRIDICECSRVIRTGLGCCRLVIVTSIEAHLIPFNKSFHVQVSSPDVLCAGPLHRRRASRHPLVDHGRWQRHARAVHRAYQPAARHSGARGVCQQDGGRRVARARRAFALCQVQGRERESLRALQPWDDVRRSGIDVVMIVISEVKPAGIE